MIEKRLDEFDAVFAEKIVKAATTSHELTSGGELQAVDGNLAFAQLPDQAIPRRLGQRCKRQHLNGEPFSSQPAGQVNQASFSTTGLQFRDGQAEAGVSRGDSHEVDVSGKNGTVIPRIRISSYTRSVVGEFRFMSNRPEMSSKRKNTPGIARCDG